MISKLKTKKGFTLVEILVVLAIMAILIAVAVPSMTGAIKDAKDKTVMSDARAALIAFEFKVTMAKPGVGVTLQDILEYIGEKDNSRELEVWASTDGRSGVGVFCYRDKNLDNGYFVVIDFEKNDRKAKIIECKINSSGQLTDSSGNVIHRGLSKL